MPSFEIVEVLPGGTTRPFPVGIYPDGKTAASIIASLKLQHPTKNFQPRPFKDETKDWKLREQRRFDEGVYEPLGLGLKPIDDHFAHRSIKLKSNVAYTPDAAYGKTDRQTAVHIKAYLNRFYPELTVDQRRKLIMDYCGEDISENLKIAKTAEEIVHVYTRGPHSCMAGDADEWGGLDGHHPVEAYAGPDLAVAYLQDGTRIPARGVIWPDKKIYGRLYGDSAMLEEALKDEGYRRASSSEEWYGARLTKIELPGEEYWDEGEDEYRESGGYLCPYLDMSGYVKVDGDYLVICAWEDPGSIGAQNTCGYTD